MLIETRRRKPPHLWLVRLLAMMAGLTLLFWLFLVYSADAAAQDNTSPSESGLSESGLSETGMSETDKGPVGAEAPAADAMLSQAFASIQGHPAVTAMRAEICQAASQFDIARAGRLPQIGFTMTGGKPLSGNTHRRDVKTCAYDDGDQALDAVIRLNQTVYDWGYGEAEEAIASNSRAAALIGLRIETERVAGDLVSLALEIRLQENRAKHFRRLEKTVAEIAARVQQRIDAGAGRLSELREARLMVLVAEIQAATADRKRDLAIGELQQRFRLTPQQAAPLVDRYLARKPAVIDPVASETVRIIRRLDLQLASNALNITKLKAEKRPRLSGTLQSTLYDVDNNNGEYEVVGKLEMTMPLYDGGSNAARRRETAWIAAGIRSERENAIRDHSTQTQGMIRQLGEMRANIEETEDKLVEQRQKLVSIKAREGQTQSDPLAIARAETEIAVLENALITYNNTIALLLLRGLVLADRLSQALDIPLGGPEC